MPPKKKKKGKKKPQWKRFRRANRRDLAIAPGAAADEAAPGAITERVDPDVPPVATAPNLIEISEFTEGWVPDYENAAVPPNALRRSMNLLPDIGTGALQVRPGFKRLAQVTAGYRIETVKHYARGDKKNYLMVVGTTGDDNVAGNVAVWAVNLTTGDVTLVSPSTTGAPSKVWAKGDARHYGIVVGDTYFGGGSDERMYSWHPGEGWNGAPTIPSPPYPVYGGMTRPESYAFEKGDEVLYTDPVHGERAFSADKNNRFKKWEGGGAEDYEKQDKVSIKRDINGKNVWRSYKCKKAHESSVELRPGDGTGNWRKYWKKEKLDAPADEDGRVSDDWNLIPTAPKTNLGVWHGERMWLRADDIAPAVTARQRLIFSPPGKPRGQGDVTSIHWNPRDWRVGNIKGEKGREADGGGWEDFRTGDGDGIEALQSFGYHLLVFKRKSTWVISGLNRKTWNKRLLASVGCINKEAVVEHEGFVYFMGDEGLFFTDGTQVQEVAGHYKVRRWLREALNWRRKNVDITLWSAGGFIWAALPTRKSAAPTRVLVYDPNTESFWLTDLKVMAATIGRSEEGIDQLYFASPSESGVLKSASHSWLGDRHRSQSKRVLAGVTEWNLFLNPSFEPKPKVGNPWKVEDYETITEAQNSSGWGESNDHFVEKKKSQAAARRGKLGMEVTNKRKVTGRWEGIQQTFADRSIATHVISCYVRRPEWKKHKKVGYQKARMWVGNSGAGGAGTLPASAHTYELAGNGWWRVSATYTGSLTPRPHGIQLQAGQTLQVDAFHCDEGTEAPIYFDGNGSDVKGLHGVEGGAESFVYEFDHPDLDESVDDTGKPTFEAEPVRWGMTSAWFPFGVLREERRVRRVWAMVRGAVAVVLRGLRNYQDMPEWEVEQMPDDTATVVHHEGRWMPDSFSAGLSLEGLGGPAAVLGLSLDTEPRRVRYHVPAEVVEVE